MSAVAASIAPASAAADVDSSVVGLLSRPQGRSQLGSEAEKARRAELLYSLSVQRLNHLKDEVNAARQRGPDETFAYQHAVLPVRIREKETKECRKAPSWRR